MNSSLIGESEFQSRKSFIVAGIEDHFGEYFTRLFVDFEHTTAEDRKINKNCTNSNFKDKAFDFTL